MNRLIGISFMAIAVCVAMGAEAGMLRGVIPVAGSTAGAFNSQFRTSVQLNNRTDHIQEGTLVFHPAGRSATDDDPSLHYTLAPHETVSYEDVVEEMGASGLGSIDLIVEEGGVPALVARAYDDKGESGTAGTGIELVATAEALAETESTTLIVPRDLERFRFNIGVRTLAVGATLTIKVFDSNGSMREEIGPLEFAADYFIQQPAADFLGGVALVANDAIAVTLQSGDAFLYGTVTDNTTNDPSIFIATRD